MTDYRDGIVAEVTYKGARVRAARMGSGWQILEAVDGYRTWTNGDGVTGVRPLMVLDLGDDPRSYADALSWVEHMSGRPPFVPSPNNERNLVCDLMGQIRSQTKRPRIPEPGLWGVVESSVADTPMRARWVRYGTGWRNAFGGHADWADLIEPELVREGVESDQDAPECTCAMTESSFRACMVHGEKAPAS